MKNMKNRFAMIIVCLILGIVLAIQFKTVKKTFGEGDYVPTQRSEELIVELKKLKEEKQILTDELNSLEAKVKQYEMGEADQNYVVQTLYEDLQKYRILAGYETLQGEGIIITIDDPKGEAEYWDGSSTVVQNYDWLIRIISKLNAAGAEAISINDQRYTSFTEIEAAGNHLAINGVSSTTPVEIKAIGNSYNLENAMLMKGDVVWEMGYYDVEVEITKHNNVEIPKYQKIHEFRYITPVNSIND